MYRIFVLVLGFVTIYSLVSAMIIIMPLELSRRRDNSGSINPSLASLHARCISLRQILGAMFYFFGFLFFVGLQNAQHTLGLGKIPLGEILGNFMLQFVFAANVFFVFLGLHLLQWITCSRVRAYVARRERLSQR